MNIGKAAELAGLTVKTVRHYADIQVVIPEKTIRRVIVNSQVPMWLNFSLLVKLANLALVFKNVESYLRFMRIQKGQAEKLKR